MIFWWQIKCFACEPRRKPGLTFHENPGWLIGILIMGSKGSRFFCVGGAKKKLPQIHSMTFFLDDEDLVF